jgi:hypothetical protein
MYWSLEVPIWSLRPGRGAGQLGFVEETPWMGVLTQNWSHHFFLEYERNVQDLFGMICGSLFGTKVAK